MREFLRGSVTARRLLRETLAANDFQVARNSALMRRCHTDCFWFFFGDFLQQRGHPIRLKGRMTTEHFIQDRAERIGVARGCGLLRRTRCHLRRDIMGCAEKIHRTGQITVGIREFCQAEIAHVWSARFVE